MLPGTHFPSNIRQLPSNSRQHSDFPAVSRTSVHVVASAMVEDAALVIPAGNRLIVVPRLQDWRDGWPHEEGWATADTG